MIIAQNNKGHLTTFANNEAPKGWNVWNKIEGDEIIFDDSDMIAQKAVKTVFLFAGSTNLGDELKKLNVRYNKMNVGIYVVYNIYNNSFGNLKVRL